MLPKKGLMQCATCPIQHKSGKFLCGRKCYILDCGEVLPKGVCDAQITGANKWKCPKNTHKDDPDGEENFIASSF
jgi:hypothetical protein